jgi:sulfite reductase (NADPH) flavoprotein alpha-component
MPKVPSIPENAPFTAAQRIWLNGFLAGLFAQNDAESAASVVEADTPGPTPLLILFGSQTGSAEGLARRIATQATGRGFRPKAMEANGAPKVEWSPNTPLLVITSTYGDGDMPDNAQGFWDWLQTGAAAAVAQIPYAVLALGDSHYEHFCAAGKKIDARLEELGARRIHPRSDCDVDYAASAQSWADGALSALSAMVGTKLKVGQADHPQSPPGPQISEPPAEGFSRTNPFPARLLVNRRLTADGSNKEVRHFEFSLEGSGLVYEVGDALGVQPANCPTLVEDLLQTLQCDGEEAVPAPGGREISLRKALTDLFDITKPGQELLQAVAELNPDLRALRVPDRKEDLRQWLWGREVIDLLLATPQFRPGAPGFVALLRPLTPRLYSICSSPKVHSGEVHLTVSVVRHGSHGRPRKGVCSTFLADRATGRAPVPVFTQKSHGFRLPVSGDTPIIMVGPGTGVAPFRAFLHERQATGAKGRNWLFFGEQCAATDFYYRDELHSMSQSGHLTRLSTAFSRDQAEKIYVQHRMLEQAAELWAWLVEGAHFYVCGDASRMARDVDAALHRVIEQAGGKGHEQAAEFVNELKAHKRYQRDVY